MRFLIAACLFFSINIALAATPNVTVTIPVVNQSHYPLWDVNTFQFIGLTMIGDASGGAPETLTLNIDPSAAPTNGQLIITRPRGSAFKFALSFSSSKLYSTFCSFQLQPLAQDQDDISLIKTESDAPVKCSYSIDNNTHQPTIWIQDNA